MKRLLLGVTLLVVIPFCFAQPAPPLVRNPLTTNQSTGNPLNAEFPRWDAGNNQWDFVSVAAGGDVVADGTPWTPGDMLVAGLTDKHAYSTNVLTLTEADIGTEVVTNSIQGNFFSQTNTLTMVTYGKYLTNLANTPLAAARPVYDGTNILWTFDPTYERLVIDEHWLGGAGSGALGWANRVGGTGATWTGITAESKHWGMISGSGGTTSTGYAWIGSRDGGVILGDGPVYIGFCIKTPTALSDATENYVLADGLGDSSGATLGVDGLYVVYNHDTNSAKWHFVAMSNSVGTGADTGVTVQAATWYTIEITIDATAANAYCYIDGVAHGTLASGIPSGSARATGNVLGIYRKAYNALERAQLCDWYRMVGTYQR